MIWAGITFRGKTDLVFIDNGAGRGGGQHARGGFTAQRNVDEVLRPVAVPYIGLTRTCFCNIECKTSCIATYC